MKPHPKYKLLRLNLKMYSKYKRIQTVAFKIKTKIFSLTLLYSFPPLPYYLFPLIHNFLDYHQFLWNYKRRDSRNGDPIAMNIQARLYNHLSKYSIRGSDLIKTYLDGQNTLVGQGLRTGRRLLSPTVIL